MGVGQHNRRDPGFHILSLDECALEGRAFGALHRSGNRGSGTNGAKESHQAYEREEPRLCPHRVSISFGVDSEKILTPRKLKASIS
jgi:hypothetical protein